MRYLMVFLSALVFTMMQGSNGTSGQPVISEGTTLKKFEGKKVIVEGMVAKEIWQHMIAPPRGYSRDTYFDIGDMQIVVYSKDKIHCPGKVRIYGTVVRIEGSSKDPRRKEACTEYHLAADTWECLK